jgi:pyruvate-ferredoxin/flavodoxin oxidoreductase
MPREKITIDANEAVARVAYNLAEVVAIYPITPSSSMGEHADAWSAAGMKNIWGTVPSVAELQSEGGAAGAVHGALQAGSLTTTFTASQGLLLMIPNMYKIAGELTPTVFHVAARTLATHALAIYGDHSDVMATRQTGFALLASDSVQCAPDMALIANAATFAARVPFVHFFDGFRTSAEVNKIEQLDVEDIRAMIDEDKIAEFRARALNPEHPVLRGSAQNPDVFFQGREAINKYYSAVPGFVQAAMDKFAKQVGRSYHLFDYTGAPDATEVIIIMGSGAETSEETAKYLNKQGRKVGVVNVRLYRPFSVEHFVKALPATVKTIAVLDRTKEPGAVGEPLFTDVVAAINAGLVKGTTPFKTSPRILGGIYGLASKEFTPAMVKAVYDEMLKSDPREHFTVGIKDDVTNLSLDFDPRFAIHSEATKRCVFFGLGSDGTVGANKNSIKIIGEETDFNAQGYFYYDSKKSGSVTISHLRFGPEPLRAPYLIGPDDAQFVACHNFSFLEWLDVLKYAAPGGVFLINSLYGPDEVWDRLPREVQKDIIEKKLKFYVIDAYEVAAKTGMGSRVNTIMQTAFFAISNVLPRDEAIEQIKKSIKKTYGKRGDAVVQKNFEAVDHTLANLHEVKVPAAVTSAFNRRPTVPADAPEFVREVEGDIIAFEGDNLPVSAFPVDGTYPTGTTRYEKRNLALEIPVWEPDLCIQCAKCSFVCPHAVIRAKVYDPALLEKAPATFKSVDAKFKEFPGMKYTIQVAPEDCTGCSLCVQACPAKDKVDPNRKAINMAPQPAIRESEAKNWDFFMSLPSPDPDLYQPTTVKNSQLAEPLFEFSGACAGCGETPYIKLVTQLFGDRMIVANATGCTSIYGGNLPTTPWSINNQGRGPAWSNSLFEDNAEFGLGMRLTLDKQNEFAREIVAGMGSELGDNLVSEILNADQSASIGIREQRKRVEALKTKLAKSKDSRAKMLVSIADSLVKKSVWIMGGDGWAYDIGYGGLDHVIASGRNVNILVLDTEVYSNTGGQSSKSTPLGAVAKFAAKGKGIGKKDLGLIAMSYRYVYVASIAMGSSDQHALKAILEAEAYDGPSLIIAYSHCIAHGMADMKNGLDQQKLAVQAGVWPLYRYNPALLDEGKNPLQLDSKDPVATVKDYAYNENRYRMLVQSDEARAEMLLNEAQENVKTRWELYKQMAAITYTKPEEGQG